MSEEKALTVTKNYYIKIDFIIFFSLILNMSFTRNQIKVYENNLLKIQQEFKLKEIEEEYKEILELFQLFHYINNQKIYYYTEFFQKKIKENKRIIYNTNKRLNYNINKC